MNEKKTRARCIKNEFYLLSCRKGQATILFDLATKNIQNTADHFLILLTNFTGCRAAPEIWFEFLISSFVTNIHYFQYFSKKN